MDQAAVKEIFNRDFLDSLLPLEISDQFFEALYGDADEGAYDIKLEFKFAQDNQVVLLFRLIQRPGKCLVCSLTYGLPNVFTRHPLININGMIKKIEEKGLKIESWRLGNTEEKTAAVHDIPLYMEIAG